MEVVNETNFNSCLERTATLEFSLGEVWINEKFVVKIREASGYQTLLKEGRLGDLDKNHRFTAITTNNGNMTETHVVVGAPTEVATRLEKSKKTLLKG